MKHLLVIILIAIGLTSNAQITNASLQASGLTCSMCSKAVKEALEAVAFVEKVQVDIKNQQYNLTFKQDAAVNPDALNKAVEDAGFSVASLKVTANVTSPVKLAKDQHVKIGNQYFHFLNAKGQEVNGAVSFNVVDKGFVPEKEAKKHASLSKMKCVQTGKTASCCATEAIPAESRVFHVII
jgi:copper chaperone CopZ